MSSNRLEQRRAEIDAETLREFEAQRLSKALSLIPGRYAAGWGWEGYRAPENARLIPILKQLKAWADDFDNQKTGFWAYGGTGSGKTGAIYGLIVYLIKVKQLSSVHAVNTLDLKSDLLSAFGEKNNRKYDEIKQPVLTSKLLLFDDVGAGQRKDWEIELLLEIVNTRNANRLITIFTSNYALEDLACNDDMQRIISRIEESTAPLFINGSDLRKGG
jgi:DNA replication protein DnaC